MSMESPIYSTVLSGLTSQIDIITKDFVFHGYNALANALSAPLASVCILSIVLMGYGISRGAIKAPMDAMYGFIFRMGFIYFFAMNWGNFSEYFVDFFIKGMGELGTILMKATSAKDAHLEGVTDGLQSLYTDIIRMGVWTAKKASLRHWAPIVVSFLIFLFGSIVVLFALFELIAAKLMISLCFCTAPFFIILTLFKETRPFFDRWLGFVVGFSLVLLFVSAVMGLSMSLLHWSIAGLLANEAENMDLVGWIPLAVVAVFCTACLFKAVAIAKHIGGACHTGTGASMVGSFIGGTIGAGAATKAFSQKTREVSGKMASSVKSGLTGGASKLAKSIQNSLRKGE